MSRWLVGSSSSSRSGCADQARASSTRRRQPPDSVSTEPSAGRSSRESISSTRCSNRQPSRSSSSCCSRAQPLERGRLAVRRGRRRVVVVGDEQLQIAESLGDDVEHRPVGGKRNVLHQPGHAQARLPPHLPLSGGSVPASTWSSVDLPVPFRPTTAMRSPGSIWRETESRRGRWP